jgi:hypothetical protein
MGPEYMQIVKINLPMDYNNRRLKLGKGLEVHYLLGNNNLLDI